MEFQPSSRISMNNPFFIHPVYSNEAQLPANNERSLLLPVEVRLQQNKQRRLIIQKEKQKYKETILNQRRFKQDNVHKILRQKQQAKQSAQLIFHNMQKTSMARFDDTEHWRKVQDIEQKIHQCRTRADQYRTVYKKQIHQNRQDRQKSVKFRRDLTNKQENEKIMNYHLAEWKSYERKIAEKYKSQDKNPLRIYANLTKKQQQLKQIIQRQLQSSKSQKSLPIQFSTIGFKPIKGRNKENKKDQWIPLQTIPNQSNKQKNNLICSTHQISMFGLSKSIKNPQRMLKQMRQFLGTHIMLEEPNKDKELIAKFQEYLYQIKDIS